MRNVDADPPPKWLDDVAGWLVTMSEGRFGLCRMLLWIRTADGGPEEASVVMPHPEYTEIERAVVGDGRAILTALWHHGFLPGDRPAENTSAPVLDERRPR